MCRQCPDPNSSYEHYRFFHFEWDVKLAKQILADREPAGEMTPDDVRKYGLGVDPPVANKDGYFSINLLGPCEEHLQHIPADKVDEPIIVGPLDAAGTKSMLIIDGCHRAVIKARRGEPVKYRLLTAAESLACMVGPVTYERKKFKLFPGVKPAKIPQEVTA